MFSVNFGRILPAVSALLLSVLPAHAAAPSKSKIGIHLIDRNTAGVRRITDAHPRVIKILDTSGPMLEAARQYKSTTPEGIVVLRVYTGKRYELTANPESSARDFFKSVLASPLKKLSERDRRSIDYVEGPNECDSTPCWDSIRTTTWFNDFWVTLAPMIAEAGFKPCTFNIPVGNPPGPLSEVLKKIDAIVPALRVCQKLGGAWSYHAYTPKWSTDLGYQLSYSLRYRRFYEHLAKAHPDLKDLPLILTEAGFDTGGNPEKSGWQANGTAEQFQQWLTWWDKQLQEDPYVLGSTLFQIGTSNWPSFEVEPIAGWLADYLKAAGPVESGSVPAALPHRSR
ncbi:MAG: hypothetical protein AMXMBFR13_02730 [Phycisphaerae bacterium]